VAHTPRSAAPAFRPSPGAILTGIVLIAAGLRLTQLGAGFSYDEMFVVGIAGLRWGDILPMLRTGEFHPPLYYLLMRAWAGIAGTGEAAFRLPSACFGILAVVLTYGLMRRFFTAPVSLLGAFFVGVSPLHIIISQEARMYALVGMLVLASTLALLASVDGGGAVRWAGYVLISTMMAYTQYLGLLVLLAHGIWVVVSERRHLDKWMAAMAGVAILYAPWVPSLWAQAVHIHGAVWSQGSALNGRDPGDLLGLFAFGGSLFGMASYFFPGRQGPPGQFVILLPFLILMWRGGVTMASDRRRLLLLGGLPAVTVGATVALSIVIGTFYPRWLSFLLPFYAMFIAAGIFDIAERLRGWRDWAPVVLTAGVLAFSVPVLGRYYGDPGFDHFQWRAAAALVGHQVKPGDFFLYVSNATRTAFTYYSREPRPSVTLTMADLLASGGGPPLFTDARARELAAQHPRVWVIVGIPFTQPMQKQLFGALEDPFRVVGARQFTGIGIYLLTARTP
jgi:hypothetical protein